MVRIVGISLLVILVGVAGAWALQAMGVVNFEQMMLDQLVTVPAFSDRVAVYRLGQSRNDEITAIEAALEHERQLTEAERLRLEAEHAALAKEWSELELARSAIDAERAKLDSEWQALYEARSIEENIARLVVLYEEMKPSELAAVADGLEDVLLVQLLLEMDERRAASLLAQLPPARAAKLSRIIAGERG